ncbi:hypothetical protein D3C75_855510 [compost metagenome]
MGDHRPCHTGRAALVAFPGAVGSTQCTDPAAIVTIHRPAGAHPLVGVHRGYTITELVLHTGGTGYRGLLAITPTAVMRQVHSQLWRVEFVIPAQRQTEA